MATRDSQRSRVFDAERQFAIARAVPLTVEQVQTLADRVTRSAWFTKQKPGFTRIGVIGRHHQPYCHQTPTSTAIGQSGITRVWSFDMKDLNAVVFLHELAHHLQPQSTVTHGPEYCKAMLECVRKWISPDAKKALLAIYREHKVKTKVYSAEAKARLSANAAKARSVTVTEDLQDLLGELSGEKPVSERPTHLFQPRKTQDP